MKESKVISAQELRERVFKKFSEKLNQESVFDLLREVADSGEFELRVHQEDYATDVYMLAKYLNSLGYNTSIEMFHGGYPASKRVLVITW
jgi:hypothetical protein